MGCAPTLCFQAWRPYLSPLSTAWSLGVFPRLSAALVPGLVIFSHFCCHRSNGFSLPSSCIGLLHPAALSSWSSGVPVLDPFGPMCHFSPFWGLGDAALPHSLRPGASGASYSSLLSAGTLPPMSILSILRPDSLAASHMRQPVPPLSPLSIPATLGLWVDHFPLFSWRAVLLGLSCHVLPPCASGGRRHPSGAVRSVCLARILGPCPPRGVPDGQSLLFLRWLDFRFWWRRSRGLARPPYRRRVSPFASPGTWLAVAGTHPPTHARTHARLLTPGHALAPRAFRSRGLLLSLVPRRIFGREGLLRFWGGFSPACLDSHFRQGLRMGSGGSLHGT